VKRVLPDLERSAAAIAARGCALGSPLHLLSETTSTNDEAKRGAKSGAPHGSTWVAESQLAGRGRQGRTWMSSPGEDVLVSVLLRVSCPPMRLPLLALVAGLAARDAIAAAAPQADVRIKWPNDVVVVGARGFRKIAGVLVESTMAGREVEALVVGIGINVHARDFPADIADRATSVGLVSSRPPDRAAILADTLHILDRDVGIVAAKGLGVVHARLSSADALRGARVRSEQGEGVAEGVDLDGRLLVRKLSGDLVRWSAGEVHLAEEC
jgi:BirA family biotin operon repressor/biotin-[acetyl-CoA-carboxylase] ligase